jgi:hypothetical protein
MMADAVLAQSAMDRLLSAAFELSTKGTQTVLAGHWARVW